MCQTWPVRKWRLARGILFLGGRFFGQKATSKLLNNAFYATLYCQIKKLPWSDPVFKNRVFKTGKVAGFLIEHPNVHLHYTPTYSSWLNQVELWFGKIERDVIARGVFTSVPDLKRKLMRYIRQYNKRPKIVKWKYFDPTHRIKAA